MALKNSDMENKLIIKAYEELIAKEVISPDEAQLNAINQLEDLSQKLIILEKASSGTLKNFFRSRSKVPKGIYFFGGVGRGKTMLMDLFFEHVPIKAKQRVHFHEFMDEIHEKISEFRKNNKNNKISGDAIPHIIKPIIKETRLLCFDEFHVNDITNAMLLSRLFEKFFHAGLVVVATSNSAPEHLYKDGLNRELFLPFIDMLNSHVQVLELKSEKDFRLDRLDKEEIFHFSPNSNAQIDEIFNNLIGGQEPKQIKIKNLGRDIIVPFYALGVARFDFKDLCVKSLGARDYLKISNAFHTIIIDNIPQFNFENSNEAKRFILLIDSLYDKGVKLVASFDVPLDSLNNNKRVEFEFKRTISRLNEMSSLIYLKQPMLKLK